MGRVQEIVVENFKSYEGRVVVGPFRQLSCIIGPNGSGKSNLMDAISFVLGVQSRHLRSERLRDLIYRKESEDPKQNGRTASVELIYIGRRAQEQAEEAQIEDQKQSFKRLILRGGESRFQVDGTTVTQAEYHSRLEAINILSKARNFLVFQGDVEATAQRQGKDLTAFFEQISGSDTYRQEYEQLLAEKNKTEDNARYLFTKKRNAVNEKKRVAQQSNEAHEYRELEAQRKNLQREFYLFRLHGIKRQLDETAARRDAASRDKDGLNRVLQEERSAAEQVEREKAKAHLAVLQAERVAGATKAKLDKLKPSHAEAKSRIEFLKKRVDDLNFNSEKSERRQQSLQSHVESLQKEESTLTEKMAACSRRVEEKELAFSADQRREFAAAKEESERVTAASADRRQELENMLRLASGERAKAERDVQEAMAMKDHLQRRLNELTDAVQSADVAVSRDRSRIEALAAEQERLQGSVADCSDEKEQLHEERQRLMETIQDIAATERQVAREREVAEVCANMQASVPGVHGRVVDLCRPSQKRLHVAVNVALGKFLDAVIVDSSETARKCILYLKERMLEPMTFLPLRDLRVSPMDARIGQLIADQPRLRLGLNCVAYDQSVARALEFLLGEVIIADTMSDGRRLAFGDMRSYGTSCKVVTLAGETIAKNGNLSVNSEAAKEGATRFDISDLDSARARVAEIDSRLHTIHTVDTRGGMDLASVQDDLQRAQVKMQESAMRLQLCQQQVKAKVEELQNATSTWQSVEDQREKRSAEEVRLQGELRKHEDYINKATTGLFKKLNAELGVEDVRRVHADWVREKEQAEWESDALLRRLNNTRAERAMLEATIAESAARASKRQSVPELEEELAQVLSQETALAKEVEACQAELQQQDAQVKSSKQVEDEQERGLMRRRQELKQRRQQLMALEKTMSDLASQDKAACEMRADLLRRSVLEDCEIPLLDGDGLEALQDIAEAPSQLRAEAHPVHAAGQGSSAIEMSAQIAIDFRSLAAEKQAASLGPAAQMLSDEYQSELNRLKVELDRRSPNLKAVGQMQGVLDNLQMASHEADTARKEVEAMEARFQEVRAARKKSFMDCFQKVAAEISAVYRRLTSNVAGLCSDGGTAYLDLEDTEEPYNGGIKYTAMPPGKRFRDMHLLSGGEKTLAAMALLFAIHAYQVPPFMVVDEIDAALDANNVQALANYVEQADCQMIVISLKDRFFARAEALVGVWKNKPQETSRILTLDLSKYGPLPTGVPPPQAETMVVA